MEWLILIPGPGTYTLPSSGIFGADFLLKLDASGNFIWAKQTEQYYANSGDLRQEVPEEPDILEKMKTPCFIAPAGQNKTVPRFGSFGAMDNF